MSLRAIIFDCDGVLVDSEALSIRVLLDCAREYGCDLDEGHAIEMLSGLGFPDCLKVVQDASSAALPRNFEQRYRDVCRQRFESELQAVAGVREALDEIDLLTCVASNSPLSKINHMLSVVELSDYFSTRIFSAYELGIWKPDPEIYMHVAKELSLDPTDCGVVEDSLPGIVAGLEAHMTVFAYCGDRESTESVPQDAIVFHSMLHLPALVSQGVTHGPEAGAHSWAWATRRSNLGHTAP